MRLVGTLLFVALTGSVAIADDAKPADPPADAQPAPATPATPVKTKVPLRVVRVLPDTHQALLFDKTKGTHVLAEVGKSVDGFTVEEIDDDEVTLVGENGAAVVLAAPDASWRHHREDREDAPARPTVAVAAPVGQAPVVEAAPMDPYADPAPVVRTVDAPHVIEAGEGGVRTAEAPASSPAPAAPPPAPVAVAAAPVPAPVAVATPIVTTSLAVAVPASDAPFVLPRADVAAALANFTKLASSVHGSFTPAGVKLESIIAGSLFAKAGLRAGDVITTVDNQPLHSIDDAADLYARASSARSLTIQLTRAAKPITLHILIQ